MLKKLILLLLCFLLSFWASFAWEVKVENIFSDIGTNYKYLEDLQTLYDKWIITPDSSGKFNPYQLLTREEFVWILTEVSCKKCIKPYTVQELVDTYSGKDVYFDINEQNKYFYCIADANDNWYVSWYHPWTTCDNGTNKEWERPFCPQNNITLEESIAVVLRSSNILSNSEAEAIRIEIANGLITESIADDVFPINGDGSVNSFYPDLRKALEYEVVSYDTSWNEKIFKLLEKTNGKIRPKKHITKEEFLHIAFVALQANSCIDIQRNTLALEMNIYDQTCSQWDTSCELSSLSNTNNTYDFTSEIWWVCDAGISSQWYIWRFYNETTGEEIKKYWEYLDNYRFLSSWTWKVFLRVVDNCGNTWEVYNMLSIGLDNQDNNTWAENNTWSGSDIWSDNNSLNVTIDVNPIFWPGPLNIDLEWLVSWWEWPYSYEWNYWDGGGWFGENVNYIFINEWSYTVILQVTDKDWKIWYASVWILVKDLGDINTDSDGDGVSDILDSCPLINWAQENNGCPILDTICQSDSNCSSGYYCKESNNSKNICVPKEVSNSCVYDWWTTFFWNAVCNSCPCGNFLDFNASLRNCDVIFPAITSKDGTEIYSKWKNYLIK